MTGKLSRDSPSPEAIAIVGIIDNAIQELFYLSSRPVSDTFPPATGF